MAFKKKSAKRGPRRSTAHIDGKGRSILEYDKKKDEWFEVPPEQLKKEAANG